MRRYIAAIILSLTVSLAHGMDIGCTTLNMKYGLVVCDTLPLMGWQLKSNLPNDTQTAWRVQIFDRDNGKKVFDSGKRKETASQLVSCGASLAPGSYFWRVRVWDRMGKSGPWSEQHPFIMATPAQAFGSSQWIGAITRRDAHLPTGRNYTGAILKDPAVKAAWAATDTLSRRSIILERDFNLEKEIRSAVVHVCGLGFYHLSVNGKQVGEHYFAPSWSNYDKTVFFNTFDITESLNSRADNHLEVLLGNGFYNEQGGRYRKLLVSYGPPSLRLRLTVAYTDGTAEQIESDGNWTYRLSPITFNSIYGGEDYDARLEDVVTRRAVVVQEPPAGELRPQEAYGVRIHETYPVSRRVSSTKPVFDMGQNLSGFPEIAVKGHRGDTVRLIVSEVLNADSLCDQRQTGHRNVSSAGSEIVFQNRTLVRHDFTGEYERFQYIEIALTGKDQRVVPVVIHFDAGILYRKQQGRQQQQHPSGHSEYTLKQDLREPAPGLLSLLHHVPEYEVGDQEKDFPEKEEVVYDGIEQHGRNEGPVLPFLHQHVKCDQKEREQKHDIMKMVKQQVFIHEAGKCIHHGSRDGIPLIPHETSDPKVRREPCKCIFQYIQPADNIHERFGRKQQ